MKTIHLGGALFLLAFCAYPASTSEPEAQVLPSIQTIQAEGSDQPKQLPKDKDKDKKPPEKKPAEPPPTDLFTQTPAPIRDALGFSPQMMGDFLGSFARVTTLVPGPPLTTSTTRVANGGVLVTTTTTQPTFQPRTILVPISSYGDFKVAENASPMPVDRVFTTYNYFGDIRGPGQSGTANVNREVVGFEKTFLDGRASVEVRLPGQEEQSNVPGFSGNNLSDVTIIGKYAFYLDRTAGNVFSGGLAITAPTGPQVATIDGDIHSTLIQPWLGYVWNFDRFYVQAFHSVVVPTDPRDLTLLFNDVGLNYWLYRGAPDRLLSFVVPMVEAHVTTPLDHRNADALIFSPDQVVITGGVHLGLFRNSTLSLGVATPINGPRLFNVEAFVQFNRRF